MSSVNVSTTMECEVTDFSLKIYKFSKILKILAILVLYLTQKLNYSDDDATVLYHIFTMFVYFFPLMGAILADSWLGKFK